MADDQTKQADDTSTTDVSEPPQAKTQTAGSETIYVKVYAPYKVYFEGEAKSITATNLTGTFDILPKHHSFITLLVACHVIVRTATNEETIRIQGGIMHVKSDSVIVFLDI